MDEIVPAYASTTVATDGVTECIVTVKFGLTLRTCLPHCGQTNAIFLSMHQFSKFDFGTGMHESR